MAGVLLLLLLLRRGEAIRARREREKLQHAHIRNPSSPLRQTQCGCNSCYKSELPFPVLPLGYPFLQPPAAPALVSLTPVVPAHLSCTCYLRLPVVPAHLSRVLPRCKRLVLSHNSTGVTHKGVISPVHSLLNYQVLST